MRNQNLYQLFIDELKDMYSGECQIVQSLPSFIKTACHSELKEALISHLNETNYQVTRLERIFSLLDLPVKKKFNKGMDGILKEIEGLIYSKTSSVVLDAVMIGAIQKVEHYEIASYGTLYSFAKHLDLADEIRHLLDKSLSEEKAADKKLSKLAEGSFFSMGINEEAVESLAIEDENVKN